MLTVKDDTNEDAQVKDNNDLKEIDHLKCLEYILEKMPEIRLNVNFRNREGNTVLYYAIKLNDEQIIKLLLNAGAYVCNKNHAGDVILRCISPMVLEQYLDSCISTNDEPTRYASHQIIFNCQIFQPPDDHLHVSEIEPLLILNDTLELRGLLEHPVLNSFLHIKWHQTKIYYYINVVFYVIFCLALGSYIFYTFGDYKSESTSAMVQSAKGDVIEYILRFVALLCVILALREFFQIYVSMQKYFRSFENWLEIFLIIVTFFLLSEQADPDLNRQLAATSILASGFELILLIGRHPSLSTNTEIFKTVTLNFLKFLRCYSILILGFAFSWYILYQSDPVIVDKGQNPLYELGNVVIQSFIKLTEPGNDAKLGDRLNLKHLLFVLSVFFITIVLSSLLNGLAVNDIHMIRKNARLLGIVSRMRCIWYVDTASAIDLSPFICLVKKFVYFCCCLCCRRWHGWKSPKHQQYRAKYIKILPGKPRLFPDTLPDGKIRVLPNDDMAVLLVAVLTESSGSLYPMLKYSAWKMDIDIVKQARKILEKRKSPEMMPDYEGFFKKQSESLPSDIESKLEDIYKAIDELQTTRIHQKVEILPAVESKPAADDTHAQLKKYQLKIDEGSGSESKLKPEISMSSKDSTSGLYPIDPKNVGTRESETQPGKPSPVIESEPTSDHYVKIETIQSKMDTESDP